MNHAETLTHELAVRFAANEQVRIPVNLSTWFSDLTMRFSVLRREFGNLSGEFGAASTA